jgi:hypothetical protein
VAPSTSVAFGEISFRIFHQRSHASWLQWRLVSLIFPWELPEPLLEPVGGRVLVQFDGVLLAAFHDDDELVDPDGRVGDGRVVDNLLGMPRVLD